MLIHGNIDREELKDVERIAILQIASVNNIPRLTGQSPYIQQSKPDIMALTEVLPTKRLFDTLPSQKSMSWKHTYSKVNLIS